MSVQIGDSNSFHGSTAIGDGATAIQTDQTERHEIAADPVEPASLAVAPRPRWRRMALVVTIGSVLLGAIGLVADLLGIWGAAHP